MGSIENMNRKSSVLTRQGLEKSNYFPSLVQVDLFRVFGDSLGGEDRSQAHFVHEETETFPQQ